MNFYFKLSTLLLFFTCFSCVSTTHSASEVSHSESTIKHNISSYFQNKDILSALSSASKDLKKTEDKKNFCAFLNGNAGLFNNLLIEKKKSPAPAAAGKPFSDKFEISVSYISIEKNGIKIPAANIPFIIEYPEHDENSTHNIFAKIKSDENGIISFEAPAPRNSADSVLKMYLNFFYEDENETQNSLSENTELINKELNREIKEKIIAQFDYKVQTAKKNITTTIAVLDFDQNNIPVYSANTTAVSLLRGLMQRKFLRAGLDEYRELAKQDDAITVTAAREKFHGLVERFIYGRTRIKRIEQTENKKWVCEIEGTVSVWNFKTNKKDKEFTGFYSAESNTKNGAIFNARSILGEKILSDKLLYGL